jgi:signal transduction histidine kinase
MAGRTLRPVHQMAAAARRLSSVNLHERIPLHRPKDELRELGETFNALLDRLGAAFTSQQRFVANAAHELRTPLAIQRATIQIGLGEFPVEEAELTAVRDELLAANRRHEQLIDGLLLLARGEGGLEHREPVDLAEVTEDAASPLAAQARERSVELVVRTEPATVDGDRVLLGQLVTNLVQNAIRYNRPGGLIEVHATEAELTVTNTGPEIPPDAVDGLFEPFRRLHRDRTGSASGAGLGLSIVRSIVTAHGGVVSAEANPVGGGLTVRVRLPERSRSGSPAALADCVR